ncbi:hypothetical protein ACFL1W_00890 [Candidatus Margulisiibacteriota bacterium]
MFGAQVGLAAGRSSSSYSIPSEVMASGGGHKSSAAYSIFSSYSDLSVGSISSASYSMREGWLPTSFAPLAMLVTGMTPSSGYNTGTIDITSIEGTGFLAGATVTLSRTGEADIVATNVVVSSNSLISCTFDLTGLRTGLWDLTVTNTNSQTDTLPSAFNMQTWASQALAVNSPNPFDPLAGPTTIVYQLAADTNTVVMIFNISHELVYKQDFVAGANGGRSGDNSVTWNGYNAFGELSANGVYFLRVVDRQARRILVKGKIAVSR